MSIPTIESVNQIQSLLDNQTEYSKKLKVCEENNKKYEKYIDSIEKYRETLTKYKTSKKIIPRNSNNTNNTYRAKVNSHAAKYIYSIPEPNLPPPMVPLKQNNINNETVSRSRSRNRSRSRSRRSSSRNSSGSDFNDPGD